ncbi:MAG: MunI family type II restriction endonuclease [Candidatus Paceibacterota bacterium]
MAKVTSPSERLSKRKVQPGHNREWRSSEEDFVKVARMVLDQSKYEVIAAPTTLRNIIPPDSEYSRSLGILPEAVIISKATGKQLFVEVKTQKDEGNAQERACRYYTPSFIKFMNKLFGYNYHPFITIFCDQLATKPKFVRKYPLYYEEGTYMLWVDNDVNAMSVYLNSVCKRWLDPVDSIYLKITKKLKLKK